MGLGTRRLLLRLAVLLVPVLVLLALPVPGAAAAGGSRPPGKPLGKWGRVGRGERDPGERGLRLAGSPAARGGDRAQVCAAIPGVSVSRAPGLRSKKGKPGWGAGAWLGTGRKWNITRRGLLKCFSRKHMIFRGCFTGESWYSLRALAHYGRSQCSSTRGTESGVFSWADAFSASKEKHRSGAVAEQS